MSNPILNDDRFGPQAQVLDGEPMTIQGTVNKIFLLFVCLLAGCALSVYYLFTNPAIAGGMLVGGGILSFIFVLITCFNVKSAKYLAAPYALFEGLTLGAFSALFEAQYNGIVGIGFSLFVVIIAAMSLIQDFSFIEESSNRMLSKDYEWFGAMGLMITLVWLYTEILRLLAKLNSRN